MERIKTAHILILACALLASCGNPQPRTGHTTAPCALATMLDSCLLSQPNANNNDVARGIFADTIKARFQRFKGRPLPYLADLPVEYEMCLAYPSGDKYVVKFTPKQIVSDEYKATLQVFAILEKEAVATLVDRAMYKINGTFRDFANSTRESGFILPNGKCLVDYPSVNTLDNKPYISIGTLVLDNLTFSKIDPQ